jgi:hypothetical protein
VLFKFFSSQIPFEFLHECMSVCYDFMLLLNLVEWMLNTNNLFLSFI